MERLVFNTAEHKLEDILEKYGIESAEELDKLIDGLQASVKVLIERSERYKIDRDTWQKACELACEELSELLCYCPVDDTDLIQDDDWCEKHCQENKKLLCWDRYFYQQAKKEEQQ